MTLYTDERYKYKIITIPNLLSLLRLFLIPGIVWYSVFEHKTNIAATILVISGLTDIIDGFIARQFNMISDFGKVFDPFADKLTQVSVLICLLTHFKYMFIPLTLLVIKELLAVITGYFTVKKTNVVMGAVWHGKATTLLLYTMMFVHFVWHDIPENISLILIISCSLMIILSSILYTIRNIKVIQGH